MSHAEAARAVTTSGFAGSLREPQSPYILPKRLSDALGIPVSRLAKFAGVHRNTLRNPSSERLQGKLREIVKVISAAAAITGDLTAAIYWFRNEPIADYDHKTAAELVAAAHTEAVLSYLRDIENGANG